MSSVNVTIGTRVCISGIARIAAIHTFDASDISCTSTSGQVRLDDRLSTSSLVLSDTIARSAILIVVEPCVAIISACIPTLAPAYRDTKSWSIIEVKKMFCRLTHTVFVFEPERPSSVERAVVDDAPMSEREPKTARPRLGLGLRLDSMDEILESALRSSVGNGDAV